MAALKDFATSTIVVPPSPADSGTELEVEAGHGERFPWDSFYAVVHPDGELPTLDNSEKVYVTWIDGDVFYLYREQGEASAKEIEAGWRISNAIFADDMFDSSGLSSVAFTGSYNDLSDKPSAALRTLAPYTAAGTPDIDVVNFDLFLISSLANNITSFTVYGTVSDGTRKYIRISDNGTPRSIAWGSSFVDGPAKLPTTTIPGSVTLVTIHYDATSSKWVCVDGELQSGVGGGGTWGDLTGTITDQSDLVDYIEERIEESDMFKNFKTNDIEKDGLIRYIGQSKPNSEDWLLIKIDKTTDTEITYANASNNSQTTYADAWTDRATLTYEDIGEVTI